jgi:hypothetical protein
VERHPESKGGVDCVDSPSKPPTRAFDNTDIWVQVRIDSNDVML